MSTILSDIFSTKNNKKIDIQDFSTFSSLKNKSSKKNSHSKHMSMSHKKIKNQEPSKKSRSNSTKNSENFSEPFEFSDPKKLNEKAENFIILPKKLQEELENINHKEIEVVSPTDNCAGYYSEYISGAYDTIKHYMNFDYNSIFDEKNNINVNYINWEYSKIEQKKLLILDLDETLFHSEFRTLANYKVLDKLKRKTKCKVKTMTYTKDDCKIFFEVFFRPHLMDFLNEMKKYFDLAIFTAAVKEYADTILEYIDPKNEIFKFRLYRDACIPVGNNIYVKDLRILKNFDPKNIILMDNSLYSFMNQPSNGLIVNSFLMDYKDNQLLSAKQYLINHIAKSHDVRKINNKWFKFDQLFKNQNIFDSESDDGEHLKIE